MNKGITLEDRIIAVQRELMEIIKLRLKVEKINLPKEVPEQDISYCAQRPINDNRILIKRDK